MFFLKYFTIILTQNKPMVTYITKNVYPLWDTNFIISYSVEDRATPVTLPVKSKKRNGSYAYHSTTEKYKRKMAAIENEWVLNSEG